jgi:release factor glutamine methyltransferase
MPHTIQQFLRAARQQLQDVSDNPRLDAEILLSEATGLSRAQLIAHGDRELTPAEQQGFDELLKRRSAGEPIAHLTGQREFWSLKLKVTRDTLIPRPETERLVEEALSLIPPESAWSIADLGTGSGAIAIALANERPRCHFLAVDISREALAVARENARAHGLGNILFLAGDWFAPLADERFHMICVNPPYVAETDPHLEQGDVRFEPRLALTSGAEGLDSLRHIVVNAHRHLLENGWLLLEHGYDQAHAVEELLLKENYTGIYCCRDLQGQQRLSVARRR